jgi:CrcB protein
MKNLFFAAIGAAFGGALRYWLSSTVQGIFPITFPFGTLTVNIIGSFILGFIIFFFDAREILSPEFKIILTIGFCGGFTTFSSFSLETINLLRDSEYLYAVLNISFNLVFSLLAVIAAYYLAKALLGG